MYNDCQQIILIHKKANYCEIHSKPQNDRQLNPDLENQIYFRYVQ